MGLFYPSRLITLRNFSEDFPYGFTFSPLVVNPCLLTLHIQIVLLFNIWNFFFCHFSFVFLTY